MLLRGSNVIVGCIAETIIRSKKKIKYSLIHKARHYMHNIMNQFRH